MFVCQHRKSNELNVGGAQVNTLPRGYAPPKFDLVLEVISSAEGIQLEWQYNAKLFTPERIDGLAQAYALLLQQIACDPRGPSATIRWRQWPITDNCVSSPSDRQCRHSCGNLFPIGCYALPTSMRIARRCTRAIAYGITIDCCGTPASWRIG